MDKVVVLMSTYNGEKYLKEQLESLNKLNKKDFEIYYRFRDDGSKDSTIKIIKEFIKEKNNCEFFQGTNLKSAKSFWELLRCNEQYDYWAFCDQDDVWEKDKLLKAVEMLKLYKDQPALYFSEVNIVDENIKFIEKSKVKFENTFENAFIQNPVIGCTMVFNYELKKMLDKVILEGEIGMHDSFIYRIAHSLDARIIYDENSYINYRQHGNNVIGIKTNKNLKYYLNLLLKKSPNIIGNVSELILKYYRTDIQDIYKIRVLEDVASLKRKKNLKAKFRIIFNKKFKTNNIKYDLKFKYDILLNRR